MQYKIPQNVQREDQILSFLTMRQLGILAIGGTICYIIFISLSPYFFIEVWGIALIIPAGFTLAIAFLNIGGVSFLKWFLLIMERQMVSQKRIWNNKHSLDTQMHAMISVLAVKQTSAVHVKRKNNEIEVKQEKTLAELVQGIERNNTHQDILNDTMQKIKTVRPELLSPEEKTEVILQENIQKISSVKNSSHGSK